MRSWCRLLVLMLLVPVASVSAGETRPNVLIVLTDDQHPAHLGVAGNDTIQTPSIDQLAAEGIYFENAYTITGICSPSRATLLTGLTPRSHGVTMNNFVLPPSRVTLADALKAEGYRTGIIGKGHLGDHDRPDRYPHGFDHRVLLFPDRWGTNNWTDYELWGPEGLEQHTQYITEHLTDRAIDFISDAANSEEPFLLLLSHPAVHAPINPPPGPARYRFEDMPWPPVSITDDLTNKPHQQAETVYHQRFFVQGEPLIRNNIVKSYEAVTEIDTNLGRLLTTLDDLGIRDDTIVVYLSDHGYLFGEHQLVGKGPFFYEEQMHIPLIISYPRQIPAGQRTAALTSSLDVMPTLLDLAGVTVPPDVEGISFRNVMTAGQREYRDSILLEYFNLTGPNSLPRARTNRFLYPMHGVVFKHRGQQFKWTRYLPSRVTEGDGLDYEFYDLAADPYELTNIMARQAASDNALARVLEGAEYGAAVRRARKEMARWMSVTQAAQRPRILSGGEEGVALNFKGPRHLELVWQTRQASSSEVEYWPVGQRRSASVEDLEPVRNHQVELQRLTPDTAYVLRVYSIDPRGTGAFLETEFRTPSAEPNERGKSATRKTRGARRG